MPRLTVVPKRETAEHCTAVEDGDLATPLPGGGQDDAGSGRDEDGPLSAEPALEPPVEPWWLVAVETLATHRPLQIGIVSVIAIVAAVMFWPRRENQSTPLAEIRRHPVRFEGQSVRVRGEVGEVFEIGQSFVYHLRQGRDTVVVFSPSGRPATHDKIVLLGTVSAGYLDGVPRVAVFETPGTRVTRR